MILLAQFSGKSAAWSYVPGHETGAAFLLGIITGMVLTLWLKK